MRKFRFILIILIFNIFAMTVSAQETVGGVVEFDRTVYDFGDVMLSDGPISCEFKMKNISSMPIVIYSITTTCGCTDVEWSKEPIRPGASVTVSATYSNDEGPYPFNKTLTMYLSGVDKPILLKLKGVCHKQKESLENMFPVKFGKLGIKATELKCGNLEMGESRSDVVQVANLSESPLTLSFTNLTDGLSVKVSPNPIPARSTATMTYTVSARSGVWGRNKYYATPSVAGKEYRDGLCVTAFTKENFSKLTSEQKKNGSNPMFTSSTYSVGKIKAGTEVTGTWEFTNLGKSTFKAYKLDVDNGKETHTAIPEVAPGEKGSFSVTLDTAGFPAGELLAIVTLTTNSPSRPIVNLFFAGWIE